MRAIVVKLSYYQVMELNPDDRRDMIIDSVNALHKKNKLS